MYKVKAPRKIIYRNDLLYRLGQKTIKKSEKEKRKIFIEELTCSLSNGKEEIQARFENQNNSGSQTIAELSYLHDQILRVIFEFASTKVFKHGVRTTGDKLCLVALGGFGRGELAPGSDLDLLFLLPYKHTPFTENLVEYILYVLWDLDIKIGHSVRTVDENLRYAKNDMMILTSLIESRWIWGDQELYKKFRNSFQGSLMGVSHKSFIKAKLKERDERHQKHGDSRYILEPDVKEYKGGLRDLHTLMWIIKYVFENKSLFELAEDNIINLSEAHKFYKSLNFLWTVRIHIHYLNRRSDNRLTFDIQKSISERMGYKERQGASAVERFMRHYFLVAKDVGKLTRVVLSLIDDQIENKNIVRLRNIFWVKKINGFIVKGNSISVKSENDFIEEPLKLIKIFYVALMNKLSLHPKVIKLISLNLGRVKKIRNDKEANKIFIDILTSRIENESILRLMNETGFLSKFFPDFGRVVAQMQFDMYHIYTTDEHTIRAIGILSKIEQGQFIREMPIQSETIDSLQSRRVLFVAVMLHDIAKGRGGDHSLIGAQIAEEISPRFGLEPEEVETVSWLVKYHLLMSNTAFRRDLDDSTTIINFCNIVQSLERMKLLFILTSVDIKAVGPNVWNDWKSLLLSELYYKSIELLSGGENTENISERVNHSKEKIKQHLTDWKPNDINKFLSLGSKKYWLSYDLDAHIRHAEIIKNAVLQDDNIVISFNNYPNKSNTEIMIYVPDHPGLFSKIAGALFLSKCVILDAKIQTLANGMALDTFTVSGLYPNEIDYVYKESRIKDKIRVALEESKNIKEELRETFNLNKNKNRELFISNTRVIIDNNASKEATVIEINCSDRAGLLFLITDLISELGLQILSAHVSTYGERIVDVFYVKDIFGMKIIDKTKLEKIRKSLIGILDITTDAFNKESQIKHNYLNNDIIN